MAGATIAVASDHAGFDLKELLKQDLQAAGYAVLDLGTNSTASVDYPDFGKAMGEAIGSGKAEKGVLALYQNPGCGRLGQIRARSAQ